MPKPINWDLVFRLMREHYPKEYKRILAENGKTPGAVTPGAEKNTAPTEYHKPREKTRKGAGKR